MGLREAHQSYPVAGRGRRPRRWLTATVAVAAVAMAGYAVVSYVVYDGVGRAPGGCHPADVANRPDAFVVPAGFDQAIATTNLMPAPQEVVFHSRDPQIPAAKLAAWWVPAEDPGAPAVILVHGIQSCRREANVLVPAGMLHRHGYAVLLIDLRDHGDSEGDDRRFAAGSEEYLDVLGAWDWVRAQGVPGERIGIAGMSFGSLSSVVAGGREPRVAAVWADSTATDMRTALGLFLADQLGLPDLLQPAADAIVPGAILWARLIAGDDLVAFSPIDEVARYAGRRIAFVHGELDPVLPADFAYRLHDRAAAAGAITPDAWVVPGAGHTQGVYVAPDEYERRLVGFFDEAIGGGG